MNALLIQTKLFALFASMLFGNTGSLQQQPLGETVGTPWTGMKGVTETVDEIMQRDAMLPPDRRSPQRIQVRDAETPDHPKLVNPLAPAVSQWPPAAPTSKAREGQGHGGHSSPPYSPQTIGTNFLGIVVAEGGFVPPDTQAAVGPTQILVAANDRIKVFDRNGALGPLNTTISSFFASQSPTGGTSDPEIRYDRTSGRFFVVAIDLASQNNKILIAVSSGSTITGAGSFTFYSFQQNVPAPAGNTNQFADYPSLGVDVNALYIGCNMFNGTFQTSAWVIRKSSVTSGGPIVVTAFRGLAVGAGAGPYAPRGVDNDDSTATEGYIMGVDNAAFSLLQFRRVSNPGGTPTISANIPLTVPTTVYPIGGGTTGGGSPASGSTQGLDSLDDRIFAATLHKNRITGVATLWAAHNIQTDASGVASTTGGRNSSRWYEVQNMTASPSLRQSGTLYSNASPPDSFSIPSAAMSGQGHMAIGTTISSTARQAGIACAGRLRTDGLGTTQAPTIAQNGGGTYNIGSQNGRYRWGDYSATMVDPLDDMTIWTAQEYCNANNSWGTRIIKLIAPPPALPVTCVPASLSQGATNQNIVVTGTSSAGSEFFDPDASFANHIAAAFSGTGITVNSITFTDPTHITLNVSVSGAATAGLRNLTVTNPDGQQATGSNVFTVTAGSNPVPTITSLSPTNTMFGGPTFTLTVNGTNFVNGGVSVVNWNGSPRATTFVNANQVTAQILNTDIGNSGTFNVTVVNSAPGGGTSNTAVFLVNPVQPTSYSTVEGSSGGALSNLFFSDNLYVVAQGDEGSPNEGIEVVTTAPFQTSTQLQLVIESKSSRTDGTIKLTAFNYSGLGYSDPAATWSWAATASDSTQTKTISVNVNNFIQSGTKQMKFKVQFFPSVETTAFDGWSFSIDRAHWIFTP